jgi:hypothetical protein
VSESQADAISSVELTVQMEDSTFYVKI